MRSWRRFLVFYVGNWRRRFQLPVLRTGFPCNVTVHLRWMRITADPLWIILMQQKLQLKCTPRWIMSLNHFKSDKLNFESVLLKVQAKITSSKNNFKQNTGASPGMGLSVLQRFCKSSSFAHNFPLVFFKLLFCFQKESVSCFCKHRTLIGIENSGALEICDVQQADRNFAKTSFQNRKIWVCHSIMPFCLTNIAENVLKLSLLAGKSCQQSKKSFSPLEHGCLWRNMFAENGTRANQRSGCLLPMQLRRRTFSFEVVKLNTWRKTSTLSKHYPCAERFLKQIKFNFN